MPHRNSTPRGNGRAGITSASARGPPVDAAITNFERAIALDTGFAAGYVGLANARFWQYERSRFHYRPDSMLLATAVNHARRGVALAPEFAEAHATLSYLLAASGRYTDGEHTLRIEQGYEMGRPSVIELGLSMRGAKLTSATIGGSAVTMTEGAISA